MMSALRRYLFKSALRWTSRAGRVLRCSAVVLSCYPWLHHPPQLYQFSCYASAVPCEGMLCALRYVLSFLLSSAAEVMRRAEKKRSWCTAVVWLTVRCCEPGSRSGGSDCEVSSLMHVVVAPRRLKRCTAVARAQDEAGSVMLAALTSSEQG